MREDTESGRAQSRNCEEIREEFRVRKLGFADAQPADFVKAQVRKCIDLRFMINLQMLSRVN